MSTKGWIIFGAICVVLFGTLIFWSSRDKVDVSNVDPTLIQTGSAASGDIADHVFGKKDSKVVLTEYGDFQCPGCGSAHPVVRALTEKYTNQMAFIFRNYPLTQIHPNARAAAAAVETAGKMGKYWDMHNLMYENQNAWSDASGESRTDLFAGYAKQVGLSQADFMNKFNKQSTDVNKKINYDISIGRKLNVDSTPTFYLNGKKLTSNEYNGQEAFEKTLLAAFKEQNITVPAN